MFICKENDLFSGTIKDNLIYEKTETDLTDALEISGAISFINNLAEGIIQTLEWMESACLRARDNG